MRKRKAARKKRKQEERARQAESKCIVWAGKKQEEQ